MSALGSPTPGAVEMPVRLARRRRVDWLRIESPNLLAGPLGARGWVLIDWNNNGTPSAAEAFEDVSAAARVNTVIRITHGRDLAREYGPPYAGRAEYLLSNPDGTYSSANPASPLAGKLNPGLRDKINWLDDTGTYPLHDGFIDAPAERPGISQQAVMITSRDGLAKLNAGTVSTAMHTNIRIDQALHVVADAAGWPQERRRFAEADTVLARWWVDDLSAFAAMRDLLFTEGPGANLYIDPADGFLVFENRHYRLLTPRCTESQMTASSEGDEPLFGMLFEYDPGVAGVVNSCTVPINVYTVAGGLSVVWSGPTPESLAGGETRTYVVTTTADGFTGALNPVAATDYTLTGGAVVSATLNRTSGKRATLTVVAGASGATFTGLQVRAQTVGVARKYVSNAVSGASANGVDYGVKTLPSEFVPIWLPDENTARAFCDYVVNRYKDPVPLCRFVLSGDDPTRVAAGLARKLSDRVTVTELIRAFVDDDFFVEQIGRTVGIGSLQTLIAGEAASANQYWVLGDAELGKLGETTKLAY